jgi:hypothetical protein
MHFSVIFFKNFNTKWYNYFLKKILMNNTSIFDLIWLNLDFKKIWERNCLQKFCFSLDPEPELDPDPDWAKMLDPDPY